MPVILRKQNQTITEKYFILQGYLVLKLNLALIVVG